MTLRQNLSGHTILVPGATSGIGLALALRLRERGSTVIVGGRRTEILERLTEEHPGLEAVTIDVTDPSSIQGATAEVLARHPELDVLITMAGIMEAEDWSDPAAALATAERAVTTNLLGTLRLVAALTDHLRARGDGTIMTVTSGLAHVPPRAPPTYTATKAAVHRLTEALRLQLEPEGIEMLELVPPAVGTDLMPGHRDNPAAMDLEAFADEVIALLESAPTDPLDRREILVDHVQVLRRAEIRGEYEQVLARLNP